MIDRLLIILAVDRLNVGPIATNVISWDQPHEGNLFEHLYARRSFQMAAPAAADEDSFFHGRRRQHVLRQLPP